MTTYEFDRQFQIGNAAEGRLDRHFRNRGYTILNATRSEQRRGIDRFIQHSGRRKAVEYKADYTATRTGKAFIETVSMDKFNKRGWIFTSQAYYLFYFLPLDDLCYILTLTKMRNQLERWLKECQLRSIANKGYNTIGLLVDLGDLERIFIKVEEVE